MSEETVIQTMKILVCGGRDYEDADRLFKFLNELMLGTPFTLLIHGNARGADTLAGEWARVHGVQEVSCPANWDRWGKSAGSRRNSAMLELKPDMVIAFPGGRGTAHMVQIAMGARINVVVV